MIPLRVRSLWFFWCGVMLLAGSARAAEGAWRGAAASTVITPEKPAWLAGFGFRNRPSDRMGQDLFAKVLALDDGSGHRLVVVTMDLIGLPRTLRQSLERRTAAAWQLPPEFLLLNASHTHSGPEYSVGGVPSDDMVLKDPAAGEVYGTQLEEKIFQLIGSALAKLEPVTLTSSHARAGFAMNRRLPTPAGYKNSPNPDGVVDHDVPVLRVAGADGKTRALLFGYACHNTTLNLYQVSGDYAGYAQEYLEAANPGAVALFLNGCSGDQNPYPRGTVELAQIHGRTLATAVESACGANPRTVAGPLAAAFAEIALPYAPTPSREELEQSLHSPEPGKKERAAKLLGQMSRTGRLAASYPYPIQMVRFGGEITLVALGGEVVVDYALRLKKELSGSMVWVASYSNDVMEYIPSRRVLEEGGYEARDSILSGPLHPGPWAASVEEMIVSKVHDLDRAIAKTK
jgi:neutral ceramidase